MTKLVHNIQKKQHRERSQINERSKFGFLEKHKDYVKRAKDYHKKQDTLKILRNKTKERNPDEYYHGMNSRKLDFNGMIIKSRNPIDNDESLTTDQVKLLKTQDSNYTRTLRQVELKKLQKKSNELMFQSNGKHTVFVDTQESMRKFIPEVFFNTTTEMLERRENRLTKDQLSNIKDNCFINLNIDNNSMMPKESLEKKRLKKFKLLKQHVEREKQLKQVQQKMDLQREVMKKGSKKKQIDARGNVTFKWKKQRKR